MEYDPMIKKEDKPPEPPKKKREEGLQWQDIKMTVSSDDLATALRNAGIRTAKDLQTNQQKVVNILQALYRVDLAALNRFAREG